MESLIKLSDALNPKIEAAKAALIAAVERGADAKELTALQKELTGLQTVQAKMAKHETVEGSVDEDEEERERQEAWEVMKAHIRANILAHDDYHYVHSEGKFALYRPATNSWNLIADRNMKNHHSQLVPGSAYYQAFIDVLKEDNRWFYGVTTAFNPAPGLLNKLRYQIIEPKQGTPHPLFNVLFRSVCGDKRENIEHLEKVLLAKALKPSNFLLPVICFSDGGSTGKSLLMSAVVSTLFGKSSVFSNGKMENFAGNFNGNLSGKLAILLNENCEESYNHDAIKQIAGSPTITYTDKGQMPYEGDNTALLFVAGNSIAGSIRVGGGDVDRRFSLIRGNRPLHAYVIEYFAQEHNKTITADEAKEWIESEGQHILRDPEQVAIWFNDLITRYGEVKHVLALHGADYQEAVAAQKPLWQQCAERFFNDPEFNYVRRGLVYEFYRDECTTQNNRAILGKNKFYKMLNEWVAANYADIIAVAANWGSSTADVYVARRELNGKAKPTLTPNDGFYYLPDGARRVWKVSI